MILGLLIMFTLNPAPTFTQTVQLGNPPASLSITFKHMTRQEFRAWQRRASGIALMPDDDTRDQAEAQWLMECMAGWGAPHPPTTDTGAAVDFNAQTVQQLCNAYPAAGAAIFQAFERALFEARRGN